MSMKQRRDQYEQTDRRTMLAALGAALGAVALTACDEESDEPRRDVDVHRSTGALLSIGTTAYLCTDLSTMSGENGQVLTVLGYYAINDGGQGEFYWDANSTQPQDRGIVFGTSTQGRWIRLRVANHANVKWFGAYGDALASDPSGPTDVDHDDTDALQRAFDYAGKLQIDVYVPLGIYKVTSTLVISFSKELALTSQVANYSGGRIYGGNVGGGEVFNGTKLMWAGPACNGSAGPNGYVGSTLLCLDAPDFTIEGIEFCVRVGHSAGALLNLGHMPGSTNTFNTTHDTISKCSFNCGDGTTFGQADFGVAFNAYGTGDLGNIENMLFDRCSFSNALKANVWIGPGCQPYNVKFFLCVHINSGPTGNGVAPYGIAHWMENGSGTVELDTCQFEQCACIVWCQAYLASLKLNMCAGENMKKVVAGSVGSAQTLGPITIVGGRYSVVDAQNRQSNGGFMQWPAGDVAFIDIGGSAPLTILGAQFGADYVARPGQIKLHGSDVVSEGNFYPNTRPFLRSNNYYAQKIGRTFSRGDVAPGPNSGDPQVALPVLRGFSAISQSQPSPVTFSGSGAGAGITSIDVEFDRPEPASFADGSGPVVPDYRVNVSICGISGAAIVSTPYLTNKTQNGFTINLSAAPGDGCSVMVEYELFRA